MHGGHSHSHDHDDHEHAHDHAHGHSHGLLGHSHAPTSFGRSFAIATGLNVVLVVAQFAFGLWANSLALIADAGHNLSDVMGLVLAWAAFAFAAWRPSSRFTYQMRAASILAEAYPGRRVVTVDARPILARGGGIHCITQQQPKPEAAR